MVKLNKIYTRTGDEGTTGLVGGGRVKKHSPRVEAYGTVDEAGACIGVARLHVMHDEHDLMLHNIQQDLFDLGADLATVEPFEGVEPLRVVGKQVLRLEAEIDAMNLNIPPLESFILAGGSAASAHLHVARNVVRRAERLVCALAEHEPVNPLAISYLNRLSDHLFVLARACNRDGADDVLWKPGVNRA
jgi:cob(I)alamin adenosyltransferase